MTIMITSRARAFYPNFFRSKLDFLRQIFTVLLPEAEQSEAWHVCSSVIVPFMTGPVKMWNFLLLIFFPLFI
jgi:hypothetical protein